MKISFQSPVLCTNLFYSLRCSNSSDIKCGFRCSSVSPNPRTLQTLVSCVQFYFWLKSCDVFYGLKIMLSRPRLDSLIVALWAALTMSNPPVKFIRLSHHFYTFTKNDEIYSSLCFHLNGRNHPLLTFWPVLSDCLHDYQLIRGFCPGSQPALWDISW